ncbi:MAG: hypothetical protein KJ838_00130 [Candidatus Omnitrophica bacterium]|nr:hypothetical protein [Candidatus Omnitrophota bacterium]
MEMQLSSLIEKIKKDGIEEANKKSREVIGQAEEREKAILRQAEDKAAFVIKSAEDQAAKLQDNSHKAIAQAVRDALLSLKEEIRNIFESILKKEVQRSLSDELIKELVIRIADTWLKDKDSGVEISLSPQDKKRLEALLLSGIKKELAQGITFKASPDINKGLYIGIKDENFHYDFTDEATLEILKVHLRPFIVKILDA